MKNWQRWLRLSIYAIVLLGLLYLGFNFLFLNFLVEYWWFQSLGYTTYFFLRLVYRELVLTGLLIAFFTIFFVNFRIALSVARRFPETPQVSPERRDLFRHLREASTTMYALISLVLAISLVIPFYPRWRELLLYIYTPPTGIIDDTFGVDVSYYLFELPIDLLIQRELFLEFSFLLLFMLVIYRFHPRLLLGKGEDLPLPAKIHLIILLLFIFTVEAWGIILDRHALQYIETHQPVFSGPGFVEMWVDVPLIWLQYLSFMATAAAFAVLIYRRKGLTWVMVFSGCFLFFWTAHYFSPILKQQVQTYLVDPNELRRQGPYIESSVLATLVAYDLDGVEILPFPVAQPGEFVLTEDIMNQVRNIPVWDREILDNVFEQLQGIRPYYDFIDVDVDRYDIRGRYQQVYLGAREITQEQLSIAANNWPNRHLQYTHGLGVAMADAAQAGEEPMRWFIENIPPESAAGLPVNRPAIYYGTADYPYAVVPNNLGEITASDGEGMTTTYHYQGNGDIPLNGTLRRLFLALYTGDLNLFYTTRTNDSSRFLFRRNIQERIQKITPFFLLDEDPYIVTTEKGLFWIQDAYTTSDRYPNADPYEGTINYIRNSVKIVVDAYNGSVKYYLSDPDDPIIRAYQRMFPGLIRPLDEMAPEIRKHLRYPRWLFEIQMGIYARYHQTNAETFYRQEDAWELLRNPSARTNYLTLRLFENDRNEFMILCPFRPAGRDNLRALAAVGCDGDNYGRIRIYSFPVGQQVFGPSQINALADQNTDVARNLSLWSRAGTVQRGRVIILPLGNHILYIQPVYLSSQGVRIPELKRLILSMGQNVVMDATLEGGLRKLERRLGGRQGE